jgi:hypothetical protein
MDMTNNGYIKDMRVYEFSLSTSGKKAKTLPPLMSWTWSGFILQGYRIHGDTI